MREIKFRAWNKEDKQMIYDDDEIILGYHSGAFGSFDDDRYIFMQYTGLKDKNGKEIYEGDILQADYDFVFIVKFGEYDNGESYELSVSGYGWHMQEIKDKNYFKDLLFMDDFFVIGNIYENPELLKEVENGK
jgi:uncharacterized phage protein (TIGR01671 family)